MQNFDPSLKKKKKKKKTFDLEGALGEGGADEAAQETEETLEPAKDDADDIDLENFGKKKKKKKKVLDDDAEEKGDEEKDEKEDCETFTLPIISKMKIALTKIFIIHTVVISNSVISQLKVCYKSYLMTPRSDNSKIHKSQVSSFVS